jgi:hypothetical protein
VVELASELGDVDASVRKPYISRADQEPSGVLAESQHSLAHGVGVGDQAGSGVVIGNNWSAFDILL